MVKRDRPSDDDGDKGSDSPPSKRMISNAATSNETSTPATGSVSPVTTLHRSSSAIIYEVNLSVPKEHAAEYVDYLRDFTKNVVKTVEGFTGAEVYSQPKPVGLHWLSEEGDVKSYFVVHYHCRSEEYLNKYLTEHQERLSNQDQNKWNFLVTSRRILRLQVATTL
ncbi:hypothetical protein HDU76_003041 [Blyttiomyces sp. JEL0837]|nr:hypothetical protein HDU76_003041 [Blyttiomyces sp. JEL0837]